MGRVELLAVGESGPGGARMAEWDGGMFRHGRREVAEWLSLSGSTVGAERSGPLRRRTGRAATGRTRTLRLARPRCEEAVLRIACRSR